MPGAALVTLRFAEPRHGALMRVLAEPDRPRQHSPGEKRGLGLGLGERTEEKEDMKEQIGCKEKKKEGIAPSPKKFIP